MSSHLPLLAVAHPALVGSFAMAVVYGSIALARAIADALRAGRRRVVPASPWHARADVSAALERSAIH